MIALAARPAFWQAMPDRGWPHSALYTKETWMDYALAIRDGGTLGHAGRATPAGPRRPGHAGRGAAQTSGSSNGMRFRRL